MKNPIPTARGALRTEYIRLYHQYRKAGMRNKSSAHAFKDMWDFYNGNTGPAPELDALIEAYAEVPAGTDQEDALRAMLAVRPTRVVRDDLPEDPTATMTADVREASARLTVPESFLDLPQHDPDDVLLAHVQTMVDLDMTTMEQLTIDGARQLLDDYANARDILIERARQVDHARRQLSNIIRALNVGDAS